MYLWYGKTLNDHVKLSVKITGRRDFFSNFVENQEQCATHLRLQQCP